MAYFRSSLAYIEPEILADKKYLHPGASPHYLWRDLFEPLSRGNHVVTSWLLGGFRKLGFTPPLRHVGTLWPESAGNVIENQDDFAKLWHKTQLDASIRWKVNTARRCALEFLPREPQIVTRVAVSPIVQDGTILRFRAVTVAAHAEAVRQRLEIGAQGLPVVPDVTSRVLSSGAVFIDLLAPLHEVLRNAISPEQQEQRLFDQVTPLLAVLWK